MSNAYNKIYKAENKDEISVYNHDYNKNNRYAIQTRQTITRRIRKATDKNFDIRTILQSTLNKFIKSSGKYNSIYIEKTIGCDWNAFYIWLIYLFDDEMSMENYGIYWTIDYVNPCCNFDLTNIKNQIVCFHWTNLRPIIKIDNQRKVGKIIDTEIKIQKDNVKYFLKYLVKEEKYNYTILI